MRNKRRIPERDSDRGKKIERGRKREIWITRDRRWSNYFASWTVCRWDCWWPHVDSATATGYRAMMSHGGNAKHPDDYRPRRRHHSRRCRSRRPYRPGTDRCYRSSLPSGPGTRLKKKICVSSFLAKYHGTLTR